MRATRGAEKEPIAACVSTFSQTMEALKDAHLVAKFQLYFGIQLTRPVAEREVTSRWRCNGSCKGSPSTDPREGQALNTEDRKRPTRGSESMSPEASHRASRSLGSSESRSDTGESAGSEGTNAQRQGTEGSLELVQDVDYVIKNKLWYYVFCFGAGLGYELFYASFFPIWFWNIDGAVGRRMVLLWVIIMYIGQALKDVIKWPRPSSPPVVSLEPEYAIEYGMPSTHAMVGMALPFSLLIFTHQRYEYSLWLGILFATLWCLIVCGSRLYLGMHSILDIIAGLILAALLMIILVPLVDAIDQFHLKSPYSPLITIPLIVAMAKFYPKSDRWSPARGDTCVIMGAGAGILLGSWLNYQLGIITGPGLPPPYPIIWPDFGVVGLALLRASIGIICVIASRALGKVVVFSLVCYLHNLDARDPKTRQRASVEVPYKIITYMAMGVTITYLSPVVFRMLNIERETMFTEV